MGLTTPYRPAPCASCDALRAEVAALRAVIDGRAVPPTDAEIDAHAAVGGKWRVRAQWSAGPRMSVDDVNAWAPGVARLLRGQENTHWWATDADDVLCAWPVVPAEGARS